MATSILIIGDEGRLRDGLRSVLLSFAGIDEVSTVTEFETACELITHNYPSLVILDGGGSVEDKCSIMKRLLLLYGLKPCIVIANTLEQRRHAQSEGADAVLMQGFSTKRLRDTLVALSILTDRRPNRIEGAVKSISVSAAPSKQTTWPY